MAWSWSHAADAYEAARENVINKDREWIIVVWAEWEAYNPNHPNDFNQKKYDKALKRAERCATDVLADIIWEKMEAHATCTNGGYEAHCCPFGCSPHMVPFDLETANDP